MGDDMERSCDLACQRDFRAVRSSQVALPRRGVSKLRSSPEGAKEVRFVMSRYSKLRRAATIAACVGSISVVASLAATAPAMAFPLAYNETECVPTADTLHATGSSFAANLEETLKASWSANSACKKTVPTIHYTASSSVSTVGSFRGRSSPTDPKTSRPLPLDEAV